MVFVHDQSDYARMEAARRDFVANVSHELKTPVGAMALLAEALLASADDSETVRRFAEKVLIEANRLGDMVAELIELSRLQGAERLPNVTDVDVDSIVSEAISRHKVAADNADIEVRTDAPSGLRVLGDQTLLVTALANLVSNAIAYSPRGSLVIDQPPTPRRQHRDRRHRPRYRDRPRRPGAGLRAVLPRRQGALARDRRQRVWGWPSSSTLRPTTTAVSGCGASREPDRRSRCRFRLIRTVTRHPNNCGAATCGPAGPKERKN